MANNYFLNAIDNSVKAIKHTTYCDDVYYDAIKYSVDNSVIFDSHKENPFSNWTDFLDNYIRKHTNKTAPDIHFLPCDTVTAIFDPSFKDYKYTVLNFASYVSPGGMFLQGSSAQEECLCHESTLYPVLRDIGKKTGYYNANKKNLNKYIYTNRAIYSPGIIFDREGFIRKKCDVFTCAAPNFKHAHSKYKIDSDNNNVNLLDRVKFMLANIGEYIIHDNSINGTCKRALILGAWGCGVFGQDPKHIAMLFREFIEHGFADEFDKVIFAIPSGDNFDKFLAGYTDRSIGLNFNDSELYSN